MRAALCQSLHHLRPSRFSCGILLPRVPEIELSPPCVSPILAPRCREPRSPADQIGLIVLANQRRVFEGVLGWDYCRFVAVGDGFICIPEVSPPFRRFTCFAFRAPPVAPRPTAHNLRPSTAHCLGTTRGIPDLTFFMYRFCCCWYLCRCCHHCRCGPLFRLSAVRAFLLKRDVTHPESAPLVFVERYGELIYSVVVL